MCPKVADFIQDARSLNKDAGRKNLKCEMLETGIGNPATFGKNRSREVNPWLGKGPSRPDGSSGRSGNSVTSTSRRTAGGWRTPRTKENSGQFTFGSSKRSGRES